MNSRIIYPTDDGGVAVIIPAPECGLSIEEIAAKDVPAGVPYTIIDTADVPSDRTFRAAWEADNGTPDGYGIGAPAWFVEQFRAEIDAINAEQPPTSPEILVAASIENAELPEGLTPEEREAAYQELVAFVNATNAANVEAHAKAVADWEASKAQRIAALNAQIEAQQKELAA